MLQKIKDLLLSRRLRRFLVVGCTSVLVDYLGYRLFLYLGAHIGIAKAASFICGCVVGFLLNKYWSFQSGESARREIPRFALLYATTALINTGVNWLVLQLLGIQLLAFLCATGVSTILNFLGLNFFVFRGAPAQAQSGGTGTNIPDKED